MTLRKNKILFFSPYVIWKTHTFWEATILHSLKLRGNHTKLVLCDGVMKTCDLKMRGQASCISCQDAATSIASGLNLDFEWIGRYQHITDLEVASRWVKSLSKSDLWSATFNGWQVGKWIKSTIHKNLRKTEIDLSSDSEYLVSRDLIEGGLLTALSFDRLLNNYKPDTLFLFNGRHAPYRIAYELATEKCIRTITHEVSPRKDSSILLTENAGIHNLKARKSFWKDWNDVPLTAHEISQIADYLDKRENDEHTNSFLTDGARSCDTEDLIVLFTSSEEEVLMDETWQEGPYQNQMQWIHHTVGFFKSHPDHKLIIRTHPNTAGRKAILGGNRKALREFQELKQRSPNNVAVILPDEKVDSYSLMRCAKAGLVYHSTAGLEMCCKGKFVISAAGSLISGLEFCGTPQTENEYEELINKAIELPSDFYDSDVQRSAYRFAYGLFYRQIMNLSLVHCEPQGHGVVSRLNYQNTSELKPGVDPELDAICDFVLGNRPLVAPPDQDVLNRGAQAEDEFLSGDVSDTPSAPKRKSHSSHI